MGIGVVEKRNKLHWQLTREEVYLLNRAQAQGYVTSDGRDEFDPVIAAYQDWCRTTRHPFLHVALGVATSKVIFSLLEADSSLRPKMEQQLRQRIPTYCLSQADLEIEPDYLIAGRVVNDLLPELRDWLRAWC
jgi:hypothetical protein